MQQDTWIPQQIKYLFFQVGCFNFAQSKVLIAFYCIIVNFEPIDMLSQWIECEKDKV